MDEQSGDIAAIIEGLDHPDSHLQNEMLDKLSQQADRARPVVLSKFAQATPRIRRALLRWLDEQMNAEATLPLMRYVFDEAASVSEQTGRSMAMGLLLRRARHPDSPEEIGRLRAFAEDISDDDNPDIRRVAVRILAIVGDEGSIEAVRSRTDDEDPDVRRVARKGLETLEEINEQKQESAPDDPGELTTRLLQSAGPLRRQLVRRWRRHPERSKIALRIIEHDTQLRREALQLLLGEPVSEVRPYLTKLIVEDADSDLAPLALRLLARVGDPSDITDEEVGALRLGLHASSVLTRAAACKAASAIKLDEFAPKIIAMSESRDITVALEAAESLKEHLDKSHHELFQKLLTALKTNERRRRRRPDDRDRLRTVAYLLGAIRQIVSPSTIGVKALYRTVFELLATAGNRRPLRVMGLQVLMAAAPREGVGEFDRWEPRQASVLLDLLDDARRPAARRIAQLLVRGAPEGLKRLDQMAHQLWQRDWVNTAEIIVPLLDIAKTDQADRWLQEIAEGDDKAAANEARRVLRRRRNDQDVIDVEYIPREPDRD